MPDGIYLNGNSLGLMPHSAHQAVAQRLDEWANLAVNGWDKWFGLSESLAPQIAKLMGAQAHEVVATGSITSNLHSLMATLYKPTPERPHLLATMLDFPTDVYAMQSWADREGAELRLIPSRDRLTLHPEDIEKALTPDIAIALLPTVLYRSGQLLDVEGITKLAHERGILIGWDAAHSVGCMPHQFHDLNVDFGVWCHYKYVNAGPGAPGGLFVHEKHHDVVPGLQGWWGNDKTNQFEMRLNFCPADGANAYQLGTPPILALAGLEGALSVFDSISIEEIRQHSLELTDFLIQQVDDHLPEVEVVTPRTHKQRGGHVALAHPEAHGLSLALRKHDIVPDFRQPNILRLAPTALYNTHDEITKTIQLIKKLLETGQHLQMQHESLVT